MKKYLAMFVDKNGLYSDIPVMIKSELEYDELIEKLEKLSSKEIKDIISKALIVDIKVYYNGSKYVFKGFLRQMLYDEPIEL